MGVNLGVTRRAHEEQWVEARVHTRQKEKRRELKYRMVVSKSNGSTEVLE